MFDQPWIQDALSWAMSYYSSIIWSVVVLCFYVIAVRITLPRIERSVDKSNLKDEAKLKAFHTVRLLSATVTLGVLLIVWGVDFSGLLLLSTSLLTLTGVALFATWSLLSNITAYFVLLLHSSYRRGNFVRIIDGDNYMEGFIADVNLFNIKLITEEREVVVYPNNLLLTRPVLVNPRQRWNTLGKVPPNAGSNLETKSAQP